MSVALHGNLSDFGIAEVFQLVGQQRKTGTLVVEGAETPVVLAFDEGRVVRGGFGDPRDGADPLGPQLVRSGYLTAEQWRGFQQESRRSARSSIDLMLAAGLVGSEDLDEVRALLTREALFDVLRRTSGDFNFIAEPIEHESPTESLLGAEQILMDGLRMLDEWRTFEASVPGEDTVFGRVRPLAAARALTRGAGDARLEHVERVLQLVDGRLSVRRIIDLSRLGTFEAMRALAELRQAGVIDVAENAPRKTRKQRAERGPRVAVLPLMRAAMATALPLLALAGLGAVALERAGGSQQQVGSPLPERPAAQFGDRFELERIRTELEVRRFAQGHYPERLDVLSARFDSLTPERLAAYYYVVRDDEVVLLAPIE